MIDTELAIKIKHLCSNKMSEDEFQEAVDMPWEAYPEPEETGEKSEDKIIKYQKLGLSEEQAKEAMRIANEN